MGPLIGTQTWGGGIWLRSSNTLVDGGIARSPELGVFNTDGEWIIEGDGLFPDIKVDNLPHATFNGEARSLSVSVPGAQRVWLDDEGAWAVALRSNGNVKVKVAKRAIGGLAAAPNENGGK